jgi:RNA-directed DNA polymerase
VNTGEPSWPDPDRAAWRVRQMQRKLHHWAVEDSGRLFDDVFNLVHHPDFLTVAWERVQGNKGARSAGVDLLAPASIVGDAEIVAFLGQVREQVKTRTFAPLPVRERLIPKPDSGKLRRLGIPTAMDRTVQASLLLVLEPIFEADFKPVSYGFRPRRRAQDAIAEIHALGTRNYHWVFEADIAACFDELAHPAIMERVRTRIADKRVLALIKAFLKAGIMSGDGTVGNAAGQQRSDGVGRAFLREMGCSHNSLPAGGAPQTRRCHLPNRPLRRRFRDHGGRNQSARGRIVGRSRGRDRPSGVTSVGRKVPGMPP